MIRKGKDIVDQGRGIQSLEHKSVCIANIKRKKLILFVRLQYISKYCCDIFIDYISTSRVTAKFSVTKFLKPLESLKCCVFVNTNELAGGLVSGLASGCRLVARATNDVSCELGLAASPLPQPQREELKVELVRIS